MNIDMKRKFFKMAFICLFTVVALCSCGEKNKNNPVEVTGVTLNKHVLSLAVDSSETLTATVTPDNADDKTVIWTISGATKDVLHVTVVSVTDGLVTAIAEGSAKIIATAGNKSDTCVVTVTANAYTISAKVEYGSSLNGNVDLVKAEVEYEKSNGDWDYYLVASAPYSDGGFTLKLPGNVSDLYLEALLSNEIEVPDGITVSNPNAKIRAVFLNAYMANGRQVGYFLHGSENCMSILVYANEDVSITGSYTESETYDLDEDGVYETTYTYIEKDNIHLKKGWNMMYVKETEKENNTSESEITTTVPSDAKWYLKPYEYFEPSYDHEESSISGARAKTPLLSKQKRSGFTKF
jgi:hypothetical protein